MRYRAIILDLDGTLVDTSGALTRGLNETLDSLGRSSLTEQQVRRHRDHGLRALLRAACHLTGRALTDGELNVSLTQFRSRYDHWLLEHSTRHPGVLEVLQVLREQGCHQSVLTNKPSGPALRLIASMGIAPYLDYVVTGDMGLPHKPDPAGLLLLIEQLQIGANEAIFVGSSRVDIHTARNAGIDAALCDPAASRARLLAIGGDYVLDNISQLAALASGDMPA